MFGQGVVGLLATVLLAQIPLTKLVTLDRYPIRREKLVALGGEVSLDPTTPDVQDQLGELFQSGSSPEGADLAYELSGNVETLDQAIAVTGSSGRAVIGS